MFIAILLLKKMKKQVFKSVVKYKPLSAENDSAFKTEHSLDTMTFSGSYLVEINHNGTDVGLPIEDCGKEHYIVGTLVVTDSGTAGRKQNNRVIGQVLTLTSRESKETKVYSRTFADGCWGNWRSLALAGMYNNISTTDELVATVEELVAENKSIKTALSSEITRSEITDDSMKKNAVQSGSLHITPDADSVKIVCSNIDGSLVSEVSLPLATTEKAGVMSAEDKKTMDKMFVVPKNNCYLSSTTANKYIVRIYIENKEAARADKLWLRQIANTAQSNCVVAFSSDIEAWVPIISFGNRANTKVETNNYTVGGVKAKYGKIAIIVEDWNDAELWGNRTDVTFARPESGTNLEDICFDWDEFSKPMQPSLNIADGSITQEKLSQGVQDILDNCIQVTESVASLESKVDDVVILPNNNNYLKEWTKGNQLIVRLYIENKDAALADNLHVKQIAITAGGTYSVAFSSDTAAWYPQIQSSKVYDVLETTNYTVGGVKGKYGKIALRMNWAALNVGTSATAPSASYASGTNLENICFDWNEFTKPLETSAKVADESIKIDKLDCSLAGKVAPFAKYELFSLGDSLSAGGVWQKKVADILGCAFDQSKNIKDGAMLSVGGTSSFGKTFDNVLWRAKNLIDQNYISGKGENAIVILENVNDGSSKTFDETEKTIIPTTPIEGYSDDRFTTDGSAFLEEIKDKASLNAVLRLTKTKEGKNLRIDTLPTKAGNVTLTVGWPGMYSKYNVYVVPQATDVETLDYILDKILEYSFTGATDTMGEDGRSVDFSNNEDHFPAISVSFTDTDGTGMACTVTDNPNAKGSVARYFIGDSVVEWTDTAKWQLGITYSQGWKSTIEMLQRAYPKLHIFVSLFPLHAVTAANYLLPNGTYDSAAYDKSDRMVSMRKMQVELSKIARFYSLPFIDVFAECGIGISNMLEFYNATANVHPKNEGYYRFGETVAAQLKRYMI